MREQFLTVCHITVLTSVVALSASGAHGQAGSTESLTIPRLKGPIEMDGRPSEPAWEKAKKLSPVQHSPNFGEPPTEKTEYLVGYTNEYLYVACRCEDKGPLSTPSFKRDYFTTDTDGFALLLDTFNDNVNAVGFINHTHWPSH